MKHPSYVSITILLIFFLYHVFTLLLISSTTAVYYKKGEIILESKEIVFERPATTNKYSIILMLFGILFGTILMLLIIKFSIRFVYEALYFFAIFISSSISLSLFFKEYAILLSLLLAFMKFSKIGKIENIIIDFFVFSGIVIFLYPLFNSFYALILLLIIAIYDFIAVFKTKHMIKIAEFQIKKGLFAGIGINYKLKKGIKRYKGKKIAVIGGGDVVFSILFSACIFVDIYIITLSKMLSFLLSLPPSILSTIVMVILLHLSKENKYYPAMIPISFSSLTWYFILHSIIL